MRLKMSIRLKIIIATVMLVFLSLFISGSFFFFNYYKLLVNNTYDALNVSVAQVQASVDTNMNALDNMTSIIIINQQIDAWLKKDVTFSGEGSELFTKINKLKTDLQTTLIFDNSWTEGYVQAIHIFLDNQDITLLSRNKTQYADELIKFKNAKEFASSQSDKTIFILPNDKNENIFFVKIVMNYYDDRKLFIVSEINQKFFLKELRRFSNPFSAYLVNQEGNVFFTNNPDDFGSKKQFRDNQLQKITKISDLYTMIDSSKQELTVSRKLERNNFYVLFAVKRKEVFNQIFESMRAFLFISGIILISFVVLTAFILSSFTRVIPDVVNRLNAIRNMNYKAKMPVYNDWQLDMISDTFNRMSTEIETLINKVYRNELLLKENEIKLLQSQMNPHFLTNTMTTISTGAYIRGEQQTYESISTLNKFISGRLQSTSDANFVTVESELKDIELYLYLQHLRFGDRLNYVIDIQNPALLQMRIPRLTIEPLVENAVIHGIEENIETGKVGITIKREEHMLKVEVTDNGHGFDVNEVLVDPSFRNGEREHIGIYNTNKRLQLIYGPQYGIQVESVIGEGTRVTVFIPISESNS